MNDPNETPDEATVSEAPGRDHRLEAVILQYLKAADAGRPPDRRQLREQYPDLSDALRDFFAEQDAVEAIIPPARSVPTLPARVGHCEILGELGRGGMGAVLKGRDTDLNRDVAVKVLLEAHLGKDDYARRFVEEAQIAGQLQHPGVTPVYELGAFPDRRPYFTMKLVKGQTFAAALAARTDPAAERTKYVGVFAQVCQAVAYAHARGVIHRDLKPSNVMVGAFGEVQVMDWGLAKVLKEGGVADEVKSQEQEVSVIRTQRSAGPDTPEVGSNTQAGNVLGTPAYIAPEQARGDIELVDERADVFGLGAILCEVLTGKPPYTGLGPEILRKAQTAKLDDASARLDGCGADTELIELAKRCLAAEPWDRPKQAGEVAAAVTAYQESVAERLRQAELARAAEAARAEEAKETAAQERKAKEAAHAWAQAERRRRRAQLGMAAALLLLVVLGGGAGAWYWQQRSAMAWDVEAALAEAAQQRDAGQWSKAKAALERASGRLGGGGPAELRRRLDQATADLALVDRLEDIRLKRSTIVEGQFDNRTAEQDYAAAFRDARLGAEGQTAETVAGRVCASAVREHLVAALDDWAAVTKDAKRRAWLLEVARRADPDEWRDRFRDPKVWGNRAAQEKLAAELLRDDAKLENLKPAIVAALGNALLAAKGDAVPLLAAAQERQPGDFWLNYLLGKAFHNVKKLDEAVGFFRGALAVRPKSGAAHNWLGIALAGKKRLDEAIREFRAAIALDPKHAKAHNNLGVALHLQKRLDEAIAAYRAAIQLDPELAWAHRNLGGALRLKGQLDEAITECRLAIKLDPMDALAHTNLGLALADKKQWDEAIRECSAAIKLDPEDANAHNNLGRALAGKKRLDEAIREFRTAIKLDPEHVFAHINLGHALYNKKLLEKAIREFRAAIKLDPEDANAHYCLGVTLSDMKQLDEAIEELRAAIKLNPEDALAHNGLGNALHNKGQLVEAIAEYRAAIDLDPKLVLPHLNLGNALRTKGRLNEAIGEYQAAVNLDLKDANPHNNLGLVLHEKGELDAAIREYRVAIDLDPKHAQAYGALGLSLLQLGRFEEAREATGRCLKLLPPGHPLRQPAARQLQQCEQSLALDEKAAAILKGEAKAKNPSELLRLSRFCLTQKKAPAAAARLYADAFQAEPALADDLHEGDRYTAAKAAALAGCGKGRDAAGLDEPGRAGWRKQALEWLRADLQAWANRLDGADADDRAEVRTALQRWQSDPDLAGLRDAAALEKLPEAERASWRGFWKDVSSLLEKAR